MSTASTSGTTFSNSATATIATPNSDKPPPTSASNNAGTIKPSPERKKEKKTKIPFSPRTPPKLISPVQKSSSFRMNMPPTSQSPRKLKTPGQLSSSSQPNAEPASEKNKAITSSSIFTEKRSSTPMPSSEPILRIVKAQIPIPSEVLKKLEREYVDHALVDLLIDDICTQPISPDQRHAIGRTDSAFYIDRLPEALQPYAKSGNQATISSSRIMQKVFAEEFRENIGWASAKIFYANEMFKEKSQTGYELGENDPVTKDAERQKIKAMIEVIAKFIFGSPVKLNNSPLPQRLIDALIYADQRFHERLLTGKTTKGWTTEHISDARLSLIKLLTVTRLLMPMMSALAGKIPSQKEIWCLGLAMQTLLKSASELGKEIFPESYARSSPSLQKLAEDKEKYERIQQRTKALTARTKKTAGHIRARSADTKPVDIDWLAKRDELRNRRAQDKKDLALTNTQQVLSELKLDDDEYARAIDDGKKAIEENEEFKKAVSAIEDFSPEDLAQLQKMLDDRDEQELINLLPEGEVTPERAQSLPVSTADPVHAISSVNRDSPEKN